MKNKFMLVLPSLMYNSYPKTNRTSSIELKNLDSYKFTPYTNFKYLENYGSPRLMKWQFVVNQSQSKKKVIAKMADGNKLL